MYPAMTTALWVSFTLLIKLSWFLLVDAKDIQFENVLPGNLSRLTFKMKGEKYWIRHYSLNEDIPYDYSKKFSEEVFYNSRYLEFDHIIYSGYYNVALNDDVDTSGYLHVNNPNSGQYIKSQMATNQLMVIWRKKNRGTRAFIVIKNKLQIKQKPGSTIS